MMKYIFYADIFFITNFIMDWMILGVTGKILKKRIPATSILLGALVGAAALTLNIMYPIKNSWLNHIFAYGVISFFMCAITFRPVTWKEGVKSWICLYIVAFVMGGIMNAMYFCNFYVAVGISYLGVCGSIYFLRIRMGRTGNAEDIVEVTICHKGETETVRALFDSGNSLKEPISGAPVHIIDYITADNILKGGEKTEEKIRVVPYHSLGQKAGIMTAFQCEKMMIVTKNGNVDIGPAYLGIYRGELSAGKKYRMILNRSIDKWL